VDGYEVGNDDKRTVNSALEEQTWISAKESGYEKAMSAVATKFFELGMRAGNMKPTFDDPPPFVARQNEEESLQDQVVP
jgi:hypothetical protein